MVSFRCNVSDGSTSIEKTYLMYINDEDNYFIDSENGDDDNDGLHPETALQNFRQIKSITLTPGKQFF